MSIRPIRLFTDHPESIGETYFQHMQHALFFSGQFALCALACLLHAIIPGLCTTSASERMQRLLAHMDNRGDREEACPTERHPKWPVEAFMCTERCESQPG